MQTWLTRLGQFLALAYRPTCVWPKTKPPPTGLAFDLTVVMLFFVFGIGLLIV